MQLRKLNKIISGFNKTIDELHKLAESQGKLVGEKSEKIVEMNLEIDAHQKEKDGALSIAKKLETLVSVG